MIAFKTIRARAAKRKGGEAALAALLPKVPSQKALARLADDRVLAEMAKRIFSAGFVWSVIEKKWPGFEEAFLGFEPPRLLLQPDEFWESARRRQAHRAPSAEDHGRARQRPVRCRHRPRARQLRQVPRPVAGRRSGGTARAAGQARRAPRRPHRAILPALHRQGRLRHVGRTSSPACAMPASRSRRARPRRRTWRKSRRSSTPGHWRPGCRLRTSPASAPCRSARITTPRRCAAAPPWTSDACSPTDNRDKQRSCDRPGLARAPSPFSCWQRLPPPPIPAAPAAGS